MSATDGTATQNIVVTITGTNDTATITGTATGNVTKDTSITTGGTLTVHDVDSGEAVFATPSSLSGTVVDTSGAVIPGADIVVKNNATSGESRAVSDATGNFTI
mgnify:CR=1 FL=1